MANTNPNIRSVTDGETPNENKSKKPSRAMEWFRTARDTVLGLGLWTLLPLVIAGLSYIVGRIFSIPAFTEALTWESAKDMKIWPVIAACMAALAVWGAINIKYCRYPETKIRELRRESTISTLMGILFAMLAVHLYDTERAWLTMVLPAIFQAIDAVQSTIESINNAGQKMRLDDDSNSRR